MTSTQSQDATRIRQLIEDWRKALAARDLDRMLAQYASDIVFFDAVPPYQHLGTDAYR
jgi:ketosteroid isomerase-like protein